LVADIFLIVIVAGLTVGNIVILTRGREGVRPRTVEERAYELRKLPLSVLREEEIAPQPLPVESVVLTLSGQARYFSAEGEQLGRGPFPPRSGETTTYRVVLKMEAQRGAFENVRLQGALPANVRWTGFVPQGAPVEFDKVSREVSWRGGEVTEDSRVAVFEVVLTPSFDQVGESAVLLSQISASGRERASKKVHRVYIPDVSTEEVIHK
jgi:hypothetical protein